jgi:thymidylate synthase
MEQYLQLVREVLQAGTYKPNRTGVDTIAGFGKHYEIDLGEGYPLLTTKRMDGFRWNSLIHELLWYLSGEEHIRTLREHTSIWDEWADEDGRLDTAYGRFWRRYPIPHQDDRLEGETWPDEHQWVNDDERTFDQLRYVLDQLEENPTSRRLVVNAWHPANAAISTLPPCHYSFVFNVQGDQLNLHLTQRSGDIALGVPFNIAAYSLLLEIVAQQTDFEAGTFSHTIVDAHIYCGTDERGNWYSDHLPELQNRLAEADDDAALDATRAWISEEAPTESEAHDGLDHVPGLLNQLTREPYDRPDIEIADRPIDELAFEDISLSGYDAHPGLDFAVAE